MKLFFYCFSCAEIKRLENITGSIKHSYLWVVFALGFPGNIFCIITVLSMQRMTPATFFVSLLALCDGATIFVKIIFQQMAFNDVSIGTVGCKMRFLPMFLSLLANWVLVLICAERFVSVCFPLKKAYMVTKRRSYIVTSILSTVLFLVMSCLFSLMWDSDETGVMCGTHEEYYDFWTTWWFWINAFLLIFIPFVFIVIFTALIVRGLMQSRHDRRSIMRNSSKGQDGNRRLMEEAERLERSITIMLIFAAIIFLLLTLPACIYILGYKESKDPLVEQRWKLFEQIQYVLIDSSHAINFFLYFLSAQRFRCQFFNILRCRRWRATNRKSRCIEVSVTKYTIARSNEDVSQV